MTTTHLRLVVDGTEYVYEAAADTARAKELKRVAKLIQKTRERLDARLEDIRRAEAEAPGVSE